MNFRKNLEGWGRALRGSLQKGVILIFELRQVFGPQAVELDSLGSHPAKPLMGSVVSGRFLSLSEP